MLNAELRHGLQNTSLRMIPCTQPYMRGKR